MSSSFTTPAGLFIGATQAQANQAALNYACQQARNNRPTNCNPPDMPLDQAVYVPAAGSHGAFIAAVMGPYLFTFNPTTGAVVTSKRWSPYPIANSGLVYEPVNDVLVLGAWNTGGIWWGTGNGPGKGLFVVNPTTLAVTSPISVYPEYQVPSFGGGFNGNMDLNAEIDGYIPQFVSGGIVIGQLISTNISGTSDYCTFDPSSNTFRALRMSTDAETISQMAYVGSQLLISAGPTDLALFNYQTDGNDPETINVSPYTGLSSTVQGFCIPSSGPHSGYIYCVDLSATLYRVKADLSASVSFSLGAGNDTIRRIRYNSVDGLIYIPSISANKVLVWDSASDTLSATKTGFDSPHDVVFTPSKKFAVQRGAVGLKEIV